MDRYYKLLLIIFLFLFLVEIPALQAGWIEDGVPICCADDIQDQIQITTDGSGGAIIVWRDYIFGREIYAQRINADGDIPNGWIANGVPICTAENYQFFPQIISDGAGGAIITWIDNRNFGTSDSDLYAQRIDADGSIHSGWPVDGVPICIFSEYQGYHQIVSDGAGGAIIVWNDERNYFTTGLDLYAQRIDSDGSIHSGWAADGVPICTWWESQEYLKVTSDGAEGAIITWPDERDPYQVHKDIYAQRINADGNIPSGWTTDGVPICTTPDIQEDPQIVSDGAGGAIIVWRDGRNIGVASSDLYAQRVDADGSIHSGWAVDGVPICAELGWQGAHKMISDGAGGAIIAWRDHRNEDVTGRDIYAQRIDADGSIHSGWAADGVPICTASGPQGSIINITSDGAGGAIIVWDDERDPDELQREDIYAQRIDADGSIHSGWIANGIPISTALMRQVNPQITSDGAGGAIIAWRDYRNIIPYGTSDQDLYAQRIHADGQIVATLLRSFTASLNESSITIEWTLSGAGDNMEFFILRAEGSSEVFKEIRTPEISNEGLSFSFRDNAYEPGTTYRYIVEVSDKLGRRILFETEPIRTPDMPFTLYQNYPNPFNPSTNIRYYLPENTHVRLIVYDISGKRISSLVDKEQERGFHTSKWEGQDFQGNSVASGIYFYRLKTGKQTITKKMLLLR